MANPDDAGNAIMRAAGDKIFKGKLERVKGAKGPKLAKGEKTIAGKQIVNTCPSKHTFNLKSVADVLIEHGLNPVEEILKVMPQLEPDVAARLHAELLQYVQPKLKSVEHTGKNGGPMTSELNINVRFVGSGSRLS